MSACQIHPIPPVAKQIPKADTLFGDIRIDNYFWLRNKSNPEVNEYIKAENKYTETSMKKTEKLQAKLYNEMLGRIKETDITLPVRKDNYYYYTRTEEGKQYPIYYRIREDLKAPEEILLDPNKLSKGYVHEYKDFPGPGKIGHANHALRSNSSRIFIKPIKVYQDYQLTDPECYLLSESCLYPYKVMIPVNTISLQGNNINSSKPGFMNTKMTEGMDLPDVLTAQPDEVARVIYKAQQNNRNVLYVKWMWRWIMLIIKNIPEFIFKRTSI